MIFLRRSILILLPLSASGCLNVSSVPGPVISAASPFAFTGGGTQITIRGTGFGSGAKVAVDGQPCTSQTIVSSTQINCTLPAHAPGTVAITVTGAPPNNQVATVGTFNYKIDGFTRLDRFAGQPSAMGFADGVGAKAAFSGASQVVTDGTSLYVLDGNMTIRKLDPSTGAVTTFAGRAGGIAGNTTPVDGIGSAAAFNYLSYMAYVSNPNGKFIYVLDYQVPMPPLVAILRQVNLATAQVTTINPGVSISPSGMSSDGANNLFVTSYICAGAGAILKIQVYPSVSSTDCFASGFGVFAIGAAAYDGTNLYISDGGFSIQQVDATAGGVVAPFATSGYAFSNVYSLSYDAGSLYGGEYTDVVKIPVSTGVAEQWAGSATGGEADGVGAAAQFTTAISTSTVLNGSLYFGDSGTSTVRKVSLATAAASTIAGVNGSYGEVDGSATAVKFNGARSVVSDGTYYYVGDFHGGTIRKVNIATGDTSTILSGLAGGAPTRLAMDSTKTNVFYSTN
ncbi:MAG: IPT/TIG domain-containing protein, partial [Bdellovibrionota bacterium]